MRILRSGQRGFSAAVLSVLLVSAGCTGSVEEPTGTQPPGSPLAQVTYLTGFSASGHDAFSYLAKELGFFARHGLDVTIEPGAGNQNLADLAAGQAQFTYVDLTGLLLAVGSGNFSDDDFRALASVHQRSLVAIIAPERSGVRTPADLEGLRVGALTAAITQRLLPLYAEQAGFDAEALEIVNSDPPGVVPLLVSGQVDALSTFVLQERNLTRLTGGPVTVFPFDEHLPDLLSTGIITTGTIARENPDLAARFRDAALEAVRYTIDHPTEAVSIMKKYNPAIDENHVLDEITLMTPYITSPTDSRIGAIDRGKATATLARLTAAGLISADADIDLDKLFDVSFRP